MSFIHDRTLDATNLKERGFELIKKISEMVNEPTNFGLVVPIPDTVYLTEEQYTSVLPVDEVQNMVDYFEFADRLEPSKNMLMRTGKYVLEIKVKEDGSMQDATKTREDN